MSKSEVISPVSIDLGAKNTGVHFAHYEAGSSLREIEKEGKVYQLSSNGYTLLMNKRTAVRHQRRGFDRRQMVKRLFRLIWCKEFKLPWDRGIQQSISFLLNRRGFSFLTEEYSPEVLAAFPGEAFEKLPKELKVDFGADAADGGSYDCSSKLIQLGQEDPKRIGTLFDLINKEPQSIRSSLFFIGQTSLLKEYCCRRMEDTSTAIPERKNRKLSKARWIQDKWIEEGIEGLPDLPSNRLGSDLVEYLNNSNRTTAEKIFSSIQEKFRDHEKCEKKLKASIWYFNAESFDMEKAGFNDSSENKRIKWHLHHLAYALHKIDAELKSGGRHRKKYFEEVGNVLESASHTHGYLKAFCERLQAEQIGSLTVERLSNLVGNLSNLELKPLRKYFNDEKHKKGDCWDEECLRNIFERWFTREWRVDPQKDRDKGTGQEGDYKKLRDKWTKHRGTVVDFWLATKPVYTIPPYQDVNNRRPPRCQSLILNPEFLDNNYSGWQKWLKILKEITPVQGDYLDDFEASLEGLKSGKGKPYFDKEQTGELQLDSGRRTYKELDCRVMQFVFDRTKADDILKLNEIYSRAKKCRQQQSTSDERKEAEGELEKARSESKLPDCLKTSINHNGNDIFEGGSFLHLVCAYYRERQKARAGRLFIHPEYREVKGHGYKNTRRFDDANCLLTYCGHKPRQKQYQALGDLSGVLQVSAHVLKKHVEDREGRNTEEKILNWLSGIRGMKTACKRAAEEQKERRGGLKWEIQIIFNKVGQETDARRIKKILDDSSRVKDAYKLHGFVEKAKGLCADLVDSLKGTPDQSDFQKNPAKAVYALAQINNIIFEGRSGYANTCAVCSVDNSRRMQMVSLGEPANTDTDAGGNSFRAKASRLPAIESRLIDGAVMRMAKIVSNAIANDKWTRIVRDLQNKKHVRVPIIIESNRFEFEPDIGTLKRKEKSESEMKRILRKPDERFEEKCRRIKDASNDICPYTGKKIGSGGENDHIVPRASGRGTLNDEANLIYASREGNQKKGKSTYDLENLHQKYKSQHFPQKDDAQISTWIAEQIDAEGENFKFGNYQNFISLNADEQKAFRHALFLKKSNPLRQKVIDAIDSRKKALVNGTQRYFAEALANNLYRKAKRHSLHNFLSFDYFEIEAQDSSRGDGIYSLRKAFEEENESGIKIFAKQKGESQDVYSHLIDAQLAFSMAIDAHRNEGGLKLKVGNSIHLWPFDRDTGEIFDTIFGSIQVQPDEMQVKKLERRLPTETYFAHRQIHRDKMYAERYLPLLINVETGDVLIGFSKSNSCKLEDTPENRKNLYFALKEFSNIGKKLNLANESSFQELRDVLQKYNCQLKDGHFYISLDVNKIHSYYIEKYNTKLGFQEYSSEMKFLRSLAYRTEKVQLENLSKAKKVLAKQEKFKIKFGKHKLEVPAKNEWVKIVQCWEEAAAQNNDGFLREYFLKSRKNAHEKIRRVFSLPVVTTEGKILLKRKSWNRKDIFQIVNDSDSRMINTKVFVPVFNRKENCIESLLSRSAQSSNAFILAANEKFHTRTSDNIIKIDPYQWHSINTRNTSLNMLGISSLEYRVDNNSRPRIRLELTKQHRLLELIELIGKYNKSLPLDERQEAFESEFEPQTQAKKIFALFAPKNADYFQQKLKEIKGVEEAKIDYKIKNGPVEEHINSSHKKILGVSSLKYRVDNNNTHSLCLKLKKENRLLELIELIDNYNKGEALDKKQKLLQSKLIEPQIKQLFDLLAPKADEREKNFENKLRDGETVIEYTGKGFNKQIGEQLMPVLEESFKQGIQQ